jgi:hypothetical protein
VKLFILDKGTKSKTNHFWASYGLNGPQLQQEIKKENRDSRSELTKKILGLIEKADLLKFFEKHNLYTVFNCLNRALSASYLKRLCALTTELDINDPPTLSWLIDVLKEIMDQNDKFSKKKRVILKNFIECINRNRK